MKKKCSSWVRSLLVSLSVGGFSIASAIAQPNDFSTATAQQLANQLLTTGVAISGTPTYSGPSGTASIFTSLDAGTLPGSPAKSLTLPAGIHLTVGNATGNLSGDTNNGFSGGTFFQNDADLDALLKAEYPPNGFQVRDAVSLTFDFTVPTGKTAVEFDFIFASQEGIADWDIAAVFVDGVNYAFFPNGQVLRVNAAANLTTYFSTVFPDWRSWAAPQTLVALLDPNRTVHTIKIAVANTGDNAVPTGIFLSQVRPSSVTSGGVTTSGDADGITDAQEDGVPNSSGSGSGDGNGDSILDSIQNSVTSLPTASGGGYLTIESVSGKAITGASSSPSLPAPLPQNVSSPFGAFGFTASGVTSGSTEQFKLYLPYNPAITGALKWNRLTSAWESIGSVSNIGTTKTVISFEIQDGGPYDADGSANGVIVDPIVPIGPAAVGAVASIPTLSEWSMILLAILMGVGTVVAMRRRPF